MNAAANVFFLILRAFSLYFLAVSLFGLCRRVRPLALFKTQTVWHEIRHSGVRLAAELAPRRSEIA